MPTFAKTLRNDFQDLVFRRADAEVTVGNGTAADELSNLNTGLNTSLDQFSASL